MVQCLVRMSWLWIWISGFKAIVRRQTSSRGQSSCCGSDLAVPSAVLDEWCCIPVIDVRPAIWWGRVARRGGLLHSEVDVVQCLVRMSWLWIWISGFKAIVRRQTSSRGQSSCCGSDLAVPSAVLVVLGYLQESQDLPRSLIPVAPIEWAWELVHVMPNRPRRLLLEECIPLPIWPKTSNHRSRSLIRPSILIDIPLPQGIGA